VIIGDVRGKGLDAILLARYVLSAFGRSAVAVPAMEQQGIPWMPREITRPPSRRGPDRNDPRLNAPVMFQQFTNLSNALSPAIAKHSVMHRLVVISLRMDTIRTPFWPLLTVP
jgi:hypothetical protein